MASKKYSFQIFFYLNYKCFLNIILKTALFLSHPVKLLKQEKYYKLILITYFFYSCLYYGSQVWLIPSLKGVLKSKLFSASGAALRLLDKDSSCKDLHKEFNRATPTQFQKYTTAVSLYDLIKKEIPEDEWINLQFNIQNDRQNARLSFQANNKLKCEFNCQSNRYKSITNEIDKEWIGLTRDTYKTKCKKD
jgi:hypothetical protein